MPTTLQTYPLTVDCTKTRAEMVAEGHYNNPSPHISEVSFPVTASEKDVVAVLVHLGYVASYEDVMREMSDLRMRPGTMDELCAFGSTYPHRQREFPIIALGSVWDDGLMPWVGYLWETDRGLFAREHGIDRRIGLGLRDQHYAANDRLLAVRI